MGPKETNLTLIYPQSVCVCGCVTLFSPPGTYGTRDLVNQYAAQTVATLQLYRKNDVRLATFYKFLFETWDTKVRV